MTKLRATVTAVICAYTEDRWDHLLAAIASVKGQHCPPHEVVVAVDHNPRLLQRLRGTLEGVTILESVGPKGKSGALNTAVEAAHGSIIALLDDDAEAEPRWLCDLTTEFDDPAVLGVGGYLEPVWAIRRPRWFPDEFLWVFGCTYAGMPRERSVVRNLIGANMSFRRDVFLELGGSLPGLGPDGTLLVGAARCEDTEFCMRASKRWPNRVWVYEPRARVRHNVPASRATWSYFRSRCYVEGLSKAVLAQNGHTMGTEREYVLRTLPAGVVHGIRDAVLHRDPAGIARAGAIVAGLALTTAGYVVGRMKPLLSASPTDRRSTA